MKILADYKIINYFLSRMYVFFIVNVAYAEQPVIAPSILESARGGGPFHKSVSFTKQEASETMYFFCSNAFEISIRKSDNNNLAVLKRYSKMNNGLVVVESEYYECYLDDELTNSILNIWTNWLKKASYANSKAIAQSSELCYSAVKDSDSNYFYEGLFWGADNKKLLSSQMRFFINDLAILISYSSRLKLTDSELDKLPKKPSRNEIKKIANDLHINMVETIKHLKKKTE